MSKWITGRELIDYLDIEPFELFDLIRQGRLQPYSRHGKKIVDSDSLERAPAQSYEEVEANVRVKQNADTLPVSSTRGPMTESEIKQLARRIYESQPLRIVGLPKNSIPMTFNLPNNEIEAKKAIEKAMRFLFKKDDALKHLRDRQSERDEAEEAFDIAAKIGELSKESEEWQRMAPRNITEVDIRERQLRKLGNRLAVLRKCTDVRLKSDTKRLRPCQRHREAAREIAKAVWEKDKTVTITDMAHDVLQRADTRGLFDGKTYIPRTAYNWIKDLCPDRSPGRRPKGT